MHDTQIANIANKRGWYLGCACILQINRRGQRGRKWPIKQCCSNICARALVMRIGSWRNIQFWVITFLGVSLHNLLCWNVFLMKIWALMNVKICILLFLFSSTLHNFLRNWSLIKLQEIYHVTRLGLGRGYNIINKLSLS